MTDKFLWQFQQENFANFFVKVSIIMWFTFQGDEGWQDESHIDDAWVEIELRDINDNAPVFHVDEVNVTLSEDVVPGTSIASLQALDMDYVSIY